MRISKSVGMQIAVEISEIIDQHINIIDNQGYILASTDANRIGEYHGAAKRLVEDNLQELVVYSDEEFSGAKMGINLPITLEGKTVGVVGITGHYKEVKKYGQIIKKMTEILVVDSYNKDQRRLGENARNSYVEEWLLNKWDKIPESFILRGRPLGIDLKQRWTIMIFSIISDPIEEDLLEKQKMIEKFEKIIKKIIAFDQANTLIKHNLNYVIAMTETKKGNAYKLGIDIQQEAKTNFDMDLAIGIDDIPTKGTLISQSFSRAEKSLIASSLRGGKIMFYDEVNVELFLNKIPYDIKEEYTKKLFKGESEKKIEEWLAMLDLFFKNNCSINKTAQELFIHKNTLQYRIKKLIGITGYDPRNTRQGFLYYIAILFKNKREGKPNI